MLIRLGPHAPQIEALPPPQKYSVENDKDSVISGVTMQCQNVPMNTQQREIAKSVFRHSRPAPVFKLSNRKEHKLERNRTYLNRQDQLESFVVCINKYGIYLLIIGIGRV